jgi:hypothetical protein
VLIAWVSYRERCELFCLRPTEVVLTQRNVFLTEQVLPKIFLSLIFTQVFVTCISKSAISSLWVFLNETNRAMIMIRKANWGGAIGP